MDKKTQAMVADILADEVVDRTWFGKLDSEQQDIALAVREAVQANDLPKVPKARKLIQHLGIQLSAQQVARWLSQHE